MYGADKFQSDMGLPPEAVDMFKIWKKLLTHWNKSINLVQKDTIPEFWERHALDSAQLFPFIPKTAKRFVDLGSGAGFPGLAFAIYLKTNNIECGQIDLVESAGKKCRFLRAVIRELNLPACVKNDRVETLNRDIYDVISARAFAPLPRLLDYANPFWGESTLGIFPKGRQFEEEIFAAKKEYDFDVDTKISLSDSESKILLITNLKRSEGAKIKTASASTWIGR